MTRNRLTPLWCSLAAAVFFLGLTGSAAAKGHDHMLKVGKKAGVTLSADTQVGDHVLEAGRYDVQHRVEGDSHFVKFIRLDGRQRTWTDVKCRVEPYAGKIDRTSLSIDNSGPMPRLTKIAVRGETATHWLTPTSD